MHAVTRAALATGTALVAGIGAMATGPAAANAASAAPACATGHLAAHATWVGGAAGTEEVHITLTNTGRTVCSLRGWAGVSLVYGSHGTQAGAPADRVSSANRYGASTHSVPLVTLASGRATTIEVVLNQGKVGDPSDVPAGCGRIVSTAGFRVYPPGSRTALFAPRSGFLGCTLPGLHLMQTSPIGTTFPL